MQMQNCTPARPEPIFALRSPTLTVLVGDEDVALADQGVAGATGARIAGKAAALLAREGKRYAVATQCIGGGQGIATVLEAV